MLVCGICRKFLAADTLTSGLTRGFAHTGLRHTSLLQTITTEARIALATPNEFCLS
jgi:hypothetical protein